MYYQCQCSVPFLSSLYFSCFSDVFLRSLHLFVYSFKWVIQVHHVASIHLRGCRAWETWNICFCSTLRVIKCLYPIECRYKGWIPCLLSSGHLGAIVCIYVATPSATSSSWNMSHPSKKLLNCSTKYMIYDTNQLWLKKYEVNFTNNLNDTLQSALSWFSSKLLLVVCYPEAPKNRRSSETWLGHPSSSTPLIEAEFFGKHRKYIFTSPGSSQ